MSTSSLCALHCRRGPSAGGACSCLCSDLCLTMFGASGPSLPAALPVARLCWAWPSSHGHTVPLQWTAGPYFIGWGFVFVVLRRGHVSDDGRTDGLNGHFSTEQTEQVGTAQQTTYHGSGSPMRHSTSASFTGRVNSQLPLCPGSLVLFGNRLLCGQWLFF